MKDVFSNEISRYLILKKENEYHKNKIEELEELLKDSIYYLETGNYNRSLIQAIKIKLEEKCNHKQ